MRKIRISREKHWPEMSHDDYVRAVYQSMLTPRVLIILSCFLGPGIGLMLATREAAQKIDPPFGLVIALICLFFYLGLLFFLLNTAIGAYVDRVRRKKFGGA